MAASTSPECKMCFSLIPSIPRDIGMELGGVMGLAGAVVRVTDGSLCERDSRIAAIPQLQSSWGGMAVRLTSMVVSVTLLKNGSLPAFLPATLRLLANSAMS